MPVVAPDSIERSPVTWASGPCEDARFWERIDAFQALPIQHGPEARVTLKILVRIRMRLSAFSNRILHDNQPPRATAPLPRGDERGLDCPVRRRLCIRDIRDDQRIVPAHLQRDDLARIIDRSAVQRHAGFEAAGEEQAVDVGMMGQQASGVAAALQDRENTGRKIAGLPDFGVYHPDQRRLFAGLEDHAIPRQQRGRICPLGRCAGKLNGPKTATTPWGL